MNYINFIIIFFLVSFLMIGAELYQVDKENGLERDIYNYTESSIIMPLSNLSQSHPIEQTKGIINQGRLYKILESGINFLLVSAEQVTKMGVEYGYQNPQINWKAVWKFLIWVMILIIAMLLIKPIACIIIFIIMIIITLKERRRQKRENK